MAAGDDGACVCTSASVCNNRHSDENMQVLNECLPLIFLSNMYLTDEANYMASFSSHCRGEGVRLPVASRIVDHRS